MDFLKGFQEFDIEKVVSALDEFPERAAKPAAADVTAAGAAKNRQVHAAWSELDFEAQKHEWEVLCNSLRKLPAGGPKSGGDAISHWRERAQSAEYQLTKLCNTLLGLPDPTPILESAAALSAKILEVEACNRELRAAADAAAADSKEVTALVEQHRALQAEHKALQDAMTASDAQLATAQAAAADAASLREKVESQAAEVTRLQGVLRVLREEHESTQAQLWEATSKQEQADGTRHRELEAAQDEVESLTAQCTELSLRCAELAAEKERLQQRLAAALAAATSSSRAPRPPSSQQTHATIDTAGAGAGADASTNAAVDDGWGWGGAEADAAVQPSGTDADAHWQGGRSTTMQVSAFAAAAAASPVFEEVGRVASSSGGVISGASGDEFWERQLKIRGDQVALLQAQLEQAGLEVQEMAARHEAQVRGLSTQLAAAQLAATRLQGQLEARPTLEAHTELKTRAAALQQLVDVQVESEGWNLEVARAPLAALGGPNSAPATHTLLQERNRALAAELAQSKRLASEQAAELAAATEQLMALKREAAEQLALIKRLESDLAAVQATGISRQTTGVPTVSELGQQAAAASKTAPLSLNLPPLVAGTTAGSGDGAGAGDFGEGDNGLLEPSTPPASDGGAAGSGGSNLLDILVQQRDRFRQRVTQLEEEKGTLSEELSGVKRQLEAVRADNVALYEKVRYLEQYSQKALAQGAGGRGGRATVIKVDRDGVALPTEQPGASKAHRYQCGPLSLEFGARGGAGAGAAPHPTNSTSQGGGVRARGGRSNRIGAGLCFPEDPPDEEAGTGGFEARYTKAYEARVNPFAEFQNSEMENRVRGLQLHERAVLAGGKLMVGSRLGRAFLAIYALLLHIFIMVLLYYAMVPRTRIEYVDADRLAQQQAAAAAAAAEHGRLLLSWHGWPWQ